MSTNNKKKKYQQASQGLGRSKNTRWIQQQWPPVAGSRLSAYSANRVGFAQHSYTSWIDFSERISLYFSKTIFWTRGKKPGGGGKHKTHLIPFVKLLLVSKLLAHKKGKEYLEEIVLSSGTKAGEASNPRMLLRIVAFSLWYHPLYLNWLKNRASLEWPSTYAGFETCAEKGLD